MSPSDSGNPVPDTPTSVIRVTGRIATPGRVVIACIPIVLILATPFLPFAITPTLWFGVPAVLVWMAFTVILTVVLLNVIDIGIRRQVSEHADAETFEGGERA
jgi:hypothetical protein